MFKKLLVLSIILFSLNCFAEDEVIDYDTQCLAQVISHEARAEPLKGKVAVAHVVLNRAEKWNKTICEVTNQKIKGYCQFTDLCTKKNKKFDGESFRIAQSIINQDDYMNDPTKGATYFHSIAVKPKWSTIEWRRQYEPTTRIGRHIFYRSSVTL